MEFYKFPVLPEAFFVVYFVNTEDFFNFKTKS